MTCASETDLAQTNGSVFTARPHPSLSLLCSVQIEDLSWVAVLPSPLCQHLLALKHTPHRCLPLHPTVTSLPKPPALPLDHPVTLYMEVPAQLWPMHDPFSHHSGQSLGTYQSPSLSYLTPPPPSPADALRTWLDREAPCLRPAPEAPQVSSPPAPSFLPFLQWPFDGSSGTSSLFLAVAALLCLESSLS